MREDILHAHTLTTNPTNNTVAQRVLSLVYVDNIRSVTDLMVCRSAAGYYIGTMCTVDYGEGVTNVEPYSRDSEEYWSDKTNAKQALDSGEYTPRLYP